LLYRLRWPLCLAPGWTRFTVTHSPDDRSSMARAVEWSSRVTSIAAGMVVPGVLGYWVDRKLGTGGLCLVLGVVLGFACGLWQLVQLAQKPPQGGGKSDVSSHDK
jgi:F0F1-type ATP synthase assembly protein I